MNIANHKHPSSMVDLISTKLVWALMPIPVIVALSGLIDLQRNAETTQRQLTTRSATIPAPSPSEVDAMRNFGSRNSDEVQYFQDRAEQSRETPSE